MGLWDNAAFGTTSPAEDAERPLNLWDKLFAGTIDSLATLPKRAIENSRNAIDTGTYNPGPVLEAAILPMTGAVGGTGPGGFAVGAGPIRAYHGSPHDFNRFELSKIGTGEGAQAYGHGLYFAEKEGIAKGYRDKLVGDKGNMYEVNINADPAHFLDWDKPLSQQHPTVRDAVKQAMGPNWDQFKFAKAGDAVKQGFLAPGEEATAALLSGNGVPGIKYLDQGSRGVGEGSSNYVVFNDKLIDIMRKYGIALPGGAAAADFYTTRSHEPAT